MGGSMRDASLSRQHCILTRPTPKENVTKVRISAHRPSLTICYSFSYKQHCPSDLTTRPRITTTHHPRSANEIHSSQLPDTSSHHPFLPHNLSKPSLIPISQVIFPTPLNMICADSKPREGPRESIGTSRYGVPDAAFRLASAV
jgi:hypothetical protein